MSFNNPSTRIIGPFTAVNLNSANTDVQTINGLPAKYRVLRCVAYDASVSLTTATFDLRTSSGGAGTALISAFAPSALTAATKFITGTLASAANTDYVTSTSLYIRCVTAQGAPATATFILEITQF